MPLADEATSENAGSCASAENARRGIPHVAAAPVRSCRNSLREATLAGQPFGDPLKAASLVSQVVCEAQMSEGPVDPFLLRFGRTCPPPNRENSVSCRWA